MAPRKHQRAIHASHCRGPPGISPEAYDRVYQYLNARFQEAQRPRPLVLPAFFPVFGLDPISGLFDFIKEM